MFSAGRFVMVAADRKSCVLARGIHEKRGYAFRRNTELAQPMYGFFCLCFRFKVTRNYCCHKDSSGDFDLARITSLGYLTDSEYRKRQENGAQDEKQEEQDLGDLGGARSDAGKSK